VNANDGSANNSRRGGSSSSSTRFVAFGVVAAVGVAGLALIDNEQKKIARRVAFAADESSAVNWEALRKDIASILAKDGYDDGHYGPVLVRLAWHGSS
jgi:catalase (peroxidase I)